MLDYENIKIYHICGENVNMILVSPRLPLMMNGGNMAFICFSHFSLRGRRGWVAILSIYEIIKIDDFVKSHEFNYTAIN